MAASTDEKLAACAFLESLWDLTARALLDARDEEARVLAMEADGWLLANGVGVLGADESDRWTRRFATSRRPDVARMFDRADDVAPTDPYRHTSFVPAEHASPLHIDEVACTRAFTRLTWSRAHTSPELALADAQAELRDDIGTMYLALDSGGGSDSDGRYTAFSRFAPAIPPEATELHFATGAQTARVVRR